MTTPALRIDGRAYQGTRRGLAELSRRVARYRLEGMSKKAATIRAAQEMRANPKNDWLRSARDA
jgi:hypothetical protein